jgi:hypothetical protein
MRADKIEPLNGVVNHKSPTLSECSQAEWKLLQEAIEPTTQSIGRRVQHAIEKPGETGVAALGICATGAALVLAARAPGVSAKLLTGAFGTVAGLSYAHETAHALRPVVDTWIHPENVSTYASIMGNDVGRLIYETGFAAITGGAGMAAASRINLERAAGLLAIRNTPALLAVGDTINVPMAKNISIDECIAKKIWALSELPKDVTISGRVFPAHTTDSFSASVGGIRLRIAPSGNRFYTDILSAPGKWAEVDLFENRMRPLYYANTPSLLLENGEKLRLWLQSYKGKTVTCELHERFGCGQFKLPSAQRLDSKTLQEQAAALKVAPLPSHLEYSGDSYFSSHPPEVKTSPGSIWWKRPEGTRGKVLTGSFEPYVEVGGQWLHCKIESDVIRAELLRITSESQARKNALLLRDAMNQGSFSLDRLFDEQSEKPLLVYSMRKKRS